MQDIHIPSRLTRSKELAVPNPLCDVHTDEAHKHQGDRQLIEMVADSWIIVRLHLQYNRWH